MTLIIEKSWSRGKYDGRSFWVMEFTAPAVREEPYYVRVYTDEHAAEAESRTIARDFAQKCADYRAQNGSLCRIAVE